MKFYRVSCSTSYYDVYIYYNEFNLIKETKCGYWIEPEFGLIKINNRMVGKIWVSKDGKNRMAYPTKEEALYNFYKRRERYIEILKGRLCRSERILEKVESMLNVKEKP